jgi:hypothetical protein
MALAASYTEFNVQTQHKKKRGEYTSLLLLLKSKIVPDGLHDPQQRLGERGIGIVLIGA